MREAVPPPAVVGVTSGAAADVTVRRAPIPSDMAKQFAMPVSLADHQWTEEELTAIKRNYEDYSRVVFAMGGFFFSTGMQWSFWISSSTNPQERRKLCHHNARCGMAADTELGWMGLNPNMVWSNLVYLIAGLLIMLAAKHHSKEEVFVGENSTGDTPTSPRSSLSGTSRRSTVDSRNALGLVRQLLRRGLVGLGKDRQPCTGLFGRYLTGMYFLTGSTIFVEGLLSSLYHTCPSKSFSQFDYIGITTCEVAIFLMMWSKCHPKLPSAGTFAMYMASLGLLSALEVSLPLGKRRWAWAILWFCIFFLVPATAVTMHFSLDHFCTPSEMLFVGGRIISAKFTVTRSGILIFGGVLVVTLLQIGSVGVSSDWWERVILFGAWGGTVLLAALVVWMVRRYANTTGDVSKLTYDPELHEKHRAELMEKQLTWRPIRIGFFLLWWFMGFNTCLNGLISPAEHTLSRGIMQWHGKGAMLYYLYFCGGLVHFKQITWNPLKFARLLFYTAVMIVCGLFGAVYFAFGSYKASAEVKWFGIPCETGGKPDSNICTQAYNSTLDGDYPCGQRDGRYICLVGSLDYNMGCAAGGLDGHSLWHLFSAVALFVLPLSVMVIDDLVDKPRSHIAVL